MLIAPAGTSLTISDLTDLTGSKGGQLIYHLGKFIDAGLVMNENGVMGYTIFGQGVPLSLMRWEKR
jgi:hypothetical protein